MSKLIVVDSGNIMHKAIFAFHNSSTIPATYLYMSMLIGYFKKIGVTLDDMVIIAEDYGSWRKEIDKNYKAQRRDYRESKEDADWWSEMYKEFNEFLPKLDKYLPWHVCKIYKCESDDLASIAVRYLNNFDEKILISSDEDWQQLCAIDKVKVFSPYSKKFKIVKNPVAILAKKIKGDISDNLLEVPKTEAEYEKRKMIVNLLALPPHIEQIIKPVIESLTPKNLYVNKIPYYSLRTKIKQLYKLED